MIISDKEKIVFIAIPKTGTRSIYRVMRDNFDGIVIKDHRKIIPIEYKSYYSFTVIRNPYERIVSVWWSTCKRNNDSKGYIRKFLKRDTSFLNFCRNIENLRKIKHVPHLDKQVDWINPNRINNVIKFENINKEWIELPFNKNSVKLGFLNSTIRESGNNPVKRDKYGVYLCKETIDIINKLYMEDFELGYKKII